MARFYRADLHQYKPVSTEITGYTASGLVFLYRMTRDERYLERARLTARFLCDHAWDAPLSTFPFEHPSPSKDSHHHSYFFDCGIIIRGLIAVWRVTREDRLLEMATAASHGMLADFHSGSDFHPILQLPEKRAVPRADHWSQMPGCYQAKSALAWWEVAEATGETKLRNAYLEILQASLLTYRDFLPGTSEKTRVMDRLHPACYFLEALYPMLHRADCVEAYGSMLTKVAGYLREIAPDFCRSDVYAQLLRARVYGATALGMDAAAAREEAAALAVFQADSRDSRLDGGFFFGRRLGEIVPHSNPVSTAFALQGLEVWRAFEAGEWSIDNPCQPPI